MNAASGAAEPTSMSPVDVVRTLYERFGEGNLDATYALMHDDVQLNEPGDPAVLPWAGTFRGHDGLGRFYAGLGEGLSSIAIDPATLELHNVEGGAVLVLGTERGESKSGRTYVSHSAWVWETADGKITRMTAYHDTAAMEAAFAPTD